jgi:hypothetical protein
MANTKRKSAPKRQTLREVVTLDITAEQELSERAAQYIIDMYEVKKVPTFLTDAVMSALLEAEKATGINIWQDDATGGEEFNLRALADLVTVTQGKFSFEKKGNAELAELLAQVIAHPDTPDRLYNVIVEELAGMTSLINHDSPEFIERVLNAHAAQDEKRRQKKGGAS